MMRLDELLAEILGTAAALPAEDVEWREATVGALLGRHLAVPISAALDLPRVDVSAMDGWAVRSGDLAAATAANPVVLKVIGDAAAGRSGAELVLAPGDCVRIATGAPMPQGADAVVVVEATSLGDPRGGAPLLERSPAGLPADVWFTAPARAGAAIRRRGEDVRTGAQLLGEGAELDPAAIGVLAGSGAARCTLRPRPRVVILSSGEEIGAGADASVAIPDSNGPLLEALMIAAGATVVARHHVGDSAADAHAVVREAAAGCDLLVTSGGVSVGAHDHMGAALSDHFDTVVHRVAIQPGKPLLVGKGRERSGAAWALGLPGNPVSAFVTATLVAVPLLRALAGDTAPAERLSGRLTARLTSPAARRSFPRLAVERDADGWPRRDADGTLLVAPLEEQGSHQASALARADYLGDIPETCERLAAGDAVALIALPRASRRSAR